MDFASFSQSLTLMLPRGHVGLFSSWGTEPGYAGMETTLPLLHAVLLSRPSPARPSTQTLSSAWIFKIFRRNEAEETSRFLYKPSTWIPPLLPVTAPGAPSGAQSRTASTQRALLQGVISQPLLFLSLHYRRLKEVNTAFSTGHCCHCLFLAEGSHREASRPVFEATAPGSQLTALHRALCQGWPGYRLQLLN